MANALVADTSLSGLRVTRELASVMARRGRRRTIASDNDGVDRRAGGAT